MDITTSMLRLTDTLETKKKKSQFSGLHSIKDTLFLKFLLKIKILLGTYYLLFIHLSLIIYQATNISLCILHFFSCRPLTMEMLSQHTHKSISELIVSNTLFNEQGTILLVTPYTHCQLRKCWFTLMRFSA